MITKQADFTVVGSGPGGATVARGLTRAGKKAILLERGKDWRRSPLYGTYPGALMYADRGALLFTREGLNIIRWDASAFPESLARPTVLAIIAMGKRLVEHFRDGKN